VGSERANFGPELLDLHCPLPAGSLYFRREKSGRPAFGKEADMLRRWYWAAIVLVGVPVLLFAQGPAATEDGDSAWKRISDSPLRLTSSVTPASPSAASAVLPATASSPAAEPAKRPLTHFTTGNGTLPNDAGQIWREYDISPYTTRVTSTKRPEQAVVDWVLRETGYEAWHSEPLGILCAGPRTLRVYHTPKMQEVVADVVDRFVSSEAATYTFSLRVVTLDSPNWRTVAQRLLHSVPVQTPGINAWVLPREDAAILLAQLHRRSDYREYNSPYLLVNNGQSTLISAMRGRPYVRDVILRPDTAAGFDPSPGQVDEGFNLDFSPLLSADRRMIDATIKCDVDQIEKMLPVMLDVPTQVSPRQRTKIEVPQIAHYRFHERFRWPIEQVLLVGMGMVPLPLPIDGAPLVPGVPLPFGQSPARADLLVFVECHGQAPTAPPALAPVPRSAQREAKDYRGRY
jgi:hypothetical protein